MSLYVVPEPVSVQHRSLLWLSPWGEVAHRKSVTYRVSHDLLVSSHDFLVGSHQFLVRSYNLLIFSDWISIQLDQNSGKRPTNRRNAPKKYGNLPKIYGIQPKNCGKPCSSVIELTYSTNITKRLKNLNENNCKILNFLTNDIIKKALAK